MEYPHTLQFNVEKIFGNQEVQITLYSGLTILVGTNASGKTQTLKKIRDIMKRKLGGDKVRYLSSNRIGNMEQYRSKTNQYSYTIDDYTLGDQATKRARLQIETASGDFFAMDERKDVFIKVSERLSVLFNRNIFIRWDAGHMKVFFGKTDSEQEYSVAAEASGLVNVISILAALFDEVVEVLLIDEPEVSLHPQLQSYLLREMKSAAKRYNKTIIISTHSAEMLELNTASELCNFVFFSKDALPKQISPDTPELNSAKLKEFLLRMSLIYNEGFFAKKVMLIEGSSDMILCRYLCNRLNLNLDVAGSQIIPVEGKGQFPIITKLFRLIGKEVCVLTDLDGFTDDNSIINLFSGLPEATDIANDYGNGDLQSMINIPCKHPGCAALIPHGQMYCEKHKPLHTKDRAHASERGYGAKWQRERKKFLESNPFCVKCYEEGHITMATVVDHIIPHRGDQKLFWDRSNWQPLCEHHHNVKTMTEDRFKEYRF
ncbi:AAA family ATPase [Ruminococcus sp. SR1/5]|uniref:AAA family ATPase n=1 Tax=Ruminococcus sp. SR1/5 TaxID=657323 RepID=UPI0001CD4EEA|nr:HNH endonuclease [Ruminococcus sp. SR1/5]